MNRIMFLQGQGGGGWRISRMFLERAVVSRGRPSRGRLQVGLCLFQIHALLRHPESSSASMPPGFRNNSLWFLSSNPLLKNERLGVGRRCRSIPPVGKPSNCLPVISGTAALHTFLGRKPVGLPFGFAMPAGSSSTASSSLTPPSILIPPRSRSRNFPAWPLGAKGRIHRSGSFAILTDESRLKPAETFAELDRMLKMFLADFPGAKLPAQPIPLLIFSKESRYRAFWGELAKKFNSQGPVPQSGGYAMLGIAGSFYDPGQGSVRPVYLHEACHALIARTFGLASQGGWLQEGLANYYQLRWGKKDTGVFAQNLLANRRLVPLGKLLDGSPVGMKNYAQVALFIEWILATRKGTPAPRNSRLGKARILGPPPLSPKFISVRASRVWNGNGLIG